MRLSSWLIICLLCLQLPTYSRGYGQADKKVTLSGTFTLHVVFQKIEEQTGKRVYYTNAIINDEEKVTINVNKSTVDQLFIQLFSNKDLEWTIEEKYISIRKGKLKSDLVNSKYSDSTITVTGRVINEKGEGLPGATILVRHTKTGTTSAQDGSFIIKNVHPNTILIISNIAFLTKEVPVHGKSSIGTITLQDYVGVLDETQVIAYGESSRRTGTGNVSTIKAKDIQRSPVSNPLLAIAGRVPGVFIQQAAGVPNSGVKIIIQGQNSLGNGNDPFYVIDGVPYTSQLLPSISGQLGTSGPGTFGGKETAGNPLSFINIQDIESIDILKDADATSIYGSRAANGAIIITTKKGKAGKTSININIQNGWGKISRKIDLLNLQQYMEIRKEAYANDNKTIPSVITPGAYDLTFWDQNRDIDWQKELIGGAANYKSALGSISGGNNNTKYLVSFGYQHEGTVTPGDLRDQKASVHFDLSNISENKKLKFGLTGTYVADDNKLAQVSSLANYAYSLPPNAPKLYNEDGTLNFELEPNGQSSTFENPLGYLHYGYDNKTNNLISNAVLGYQIIPGLEVKSSFGYNKLQSNEINTFPIGFLYPALKQFAQRSAVFNTAKISSWIVEPQITYVKRIQKSQIDVLLGSTFQQENRDRQVLNASGFTSDEALYNIKAASSVVVGSEEDAIILSEYKYNALFGRFGYSYSDKYILNMSVRRDGSSRFGKENRFHNFGSIGGAWVFSNESFIVDKVSCISFGKLRASYGTTGSDQIGDYSYLNLYSNISTDGGSYQGITGLQPSNDFPNPYLAWEDTKKFSASLDLGFFKDRIIINATYYKNVSSNQLQYLPLLTVTGGGAVKINTPAKVQNTGFEFLLNTRNITTKDFEWLTTINLTIPRNKLVSRKLTNDDIYIDDDLVGKALGTQKVYRFLGVDPTTGRYTVADKNGKPTSTPDASIDKTIFIDLNPKLYGGFQNSLTYKRFSLDVLFQFVDQKAANGFFGQGSPGRLMVNQPSHILDRWQKDGDVVSIQKFTTTSSANSTLSMARASDRAYSGASYARLKNLSLSYRLSPTLINNIHLQNARVYLQGQNLFTITKFKGADPENRNFTGMPLLKVITIGLQVGL